MAFNLADLLEHTVDVVPDRTAVICRDRQVTYRELDERANRLAHHLAAHGVRAGDHVGMYARNGIEALETMFAAYKLRAIAVSVNYRYVPDELRYLFANSDLVALVHERGFADKVAEVLPDAPQLRHVVVVEDGSGLDFGRYGGVEYESALAAAAGSARDFGARSGDDTYILYTGGTTGFPKGVMWRHEDVFRALGGGINFATGEYVADEWQLANAAGTTPPSVRLPISPLIHGAAQWAAFGALFNGNTLVLVPQFDPHEVWCAVDRHHIQAMTVVGDAMARPLLDAYLAGGYDGSSLGILNSHAALFSQSVKQAYLDTFPNLVMTDAIGASESGFTGLGLIGKDTDHSQGPRVRFTAQAALIDDDGTLVPREPGAIGRVARTGHLPLGYYKDPEKTKTIFVDVDGVRYVVPGDYARYEADGTVTLLGRGSQCVNTGGEKVFPEEVEGALKSHPDVFDVLVLGVPDERLGQRVAAVVQLRAGREPDVSALDAHARTTIAGYKVPRSYWFVDAVGRQPSGKPDYPWAAAYAAEHAAAARSVGATEDFGKHR